MRTPADAAGSGARDRQVGETADGLVVLRSGERARELGIEDPFASWFLTEGGRKLAEMAARTDCVYEAFNLSRFKHTSARIRDLAGGYKQVVLLGAGFDCRPLWMEEFRDGGIRVFEVDTPGKLDEKLRILASHHVTPPAWDRPIRADLRTADLPALLRRDGFDPALPTLVVAEGLTFYLPESVSRSLLDPRWLPLAPDSRILFDCWSTIRVAALNGRVMQRIGTALFHAFPFPVDPVALTATLVAMGYRDATVQTLEQLAAEHRGRPVPDEFAASWCVVEAVR